MGLTEKSTLEEMDSVISDQVAELEGLIDALKGWRNREKEKARKTEINALITQVQLLRNGMYDLSAKAFVEWYKDNSQVLQEIIDRVQENPQSQRATEYLATVKKITKDIVECRKKLKKVSRWLEKAGDWLEKLQKIETRVKEFKGLLFGENSAEK
ncbi:MAG: hypothetical protein AB1512_03015 [Thermodesulfobacteriota bacterium]